MVSQRLASGSKARTLLLPASVDDFLSDFLPFALTFLPGFLTETMDQLIRSDRFCPTSQSDVLAVGVSWKMIKAIN